MQLYKSVKKGQQGVCFCSNRNVRRRTQQFRNSIVKNALPQHPEQVVLWAREEFVNEVKNFGKCGLAKVCLLIALEDEAALSGEYKDVARFLDMGIEEEPQYQYLGTKATWSLSRLDALAAEVKATMQLESTPLTANMPLTTVQAVNEVLYGRHGYRRKTRIRDPNRAQLHCVIEEGQGTPAALAVLYIEVCRRLGFSLSAQVVDEGYYVLLRPQNTRLGIQQTELVIDPYDKGFLHNAEEIYQIFSDQVGVDNDPVGGKSLVASVLLELRDAYWSVSLGCAEHPALVPPLSLDTVLENKAWPEQYDFFRERALAACERRALLFPTNYKIKEEVAIMQYLCGQYDSAWIELAEIIENCKIHTHAEKQRQKAFLEKLRLLIEEDKNDSDYEVIS